MNIIYHKNIALIDDDSHFTGWIKESGRLDHDQYLLPKILPYCKPGSTVIDIGAYIGDHTIAYSRAVGQEGIVVAFEPNPLAFQCLEHNVSKTGNVHCIAAGVGDIEERKGLEYVGKNYGMANFSKEGNIPIMPLDKLTFKNLSFIKIDCEGYEVKALNGGVKTITQHRPVMLIEMNIATLSKMGYCYKDITDILTAWNYTFSNIDGTGNNNADQFDMLCLPG